MTDDDFIERLSSMRETMYRVSCAQLQRPCDRDDAVQEALLKAWRNRHKLRNDQYMQTWVTRILINECHNIQRKQKWENASGELPEQIVKPDSDVESRIALSDALFRLDDKLRLPIVLHYIEGFNTQEIAKILGIPKGTVLWRLSKARKELGVMLKPEVTKDNERSFNKEG